MLDKQCVNCNQNFEITVRDADFYAKIQVPHPTHCPDCRLQRRSAFRNERSLYKRKCDFTEKPMISVYSPDKELTVYHHDIWWSDKWDAKDYAQDFDFNRPFFEQFHELQKRVPRMSMMISHCENCDYAPYSVNSKNCYMSVSLFGSEDICYSYQAVTSRDCIDCSLCYGCELCYECLYGVNLYNCMWTQNCRESSDLYFSRDCQSCNMCIGCVNLRGKSLHIFNKPVSKEEYQRVLEQMKNPVYLKAMSEKFQSFSLQQPFRENYNINCENVTGDHLLNAKNDRNAFEAENLEDCAFIYTLPKGAKDCWDMQYSPDAELSYECISGVNAYDCRFMIHAWDAKHSLYIEECYYSSNLFGCIGLKNSKFCILNKEYSESEYHNIVNKIIAHMKSTREWGEFFPIHTSQFAYNETLAQDIFPLSREILTAHGYAWKEDDVQEKTATLKENMKSCESCTQTYRIIPQEQHFYKKMSLAEPQNCPSCRHKTRMQLKNPMKLWPRDCNKCSSKIQSTYSLSEQKIVHCEKCYLESVY